MNEPSAEEPRQEVRRYAGRARRARLTAVDGTDTSPESPVEREAPAASGAGSAAASGPNDERLRRERPPHW